MGAIGTDFLYGVEVWNEAAGWEDWATMAGPVTGDRTPATC